MKKLFITIFVTFASQAFALDWRSSLLAYAKIHVRHQSWGYTHAERNYQTSLRIAEHEHIAVDEEVLFAAAYLHDIGGLPEFELPGVDHGMRSAEVARPLLLQWGFPPEKIDEALDLMRDHVYTNPEPSRLSSKVFRDADMLDFLGPLGTARIFGATLEMGDSPELRNSVAVIRKLNSYLPGRFSFESSRLEAEFRIQSVKQYLKDLDRDALNGKSY